MMKLSVIAREIDELRDVGSPSLGEVAQFKEVATTASGAGYFFRDGFDNPTWLPPLARAGIFKKYSRMRSGKRLRWVVFRELVGFLSRVADKAPEETATILTSLSTKDFWAIGRLMKATLSMPPAVAAKLVGRVEKWVEASEARFLTRDVAKLMVKFVEGGEKDAALRTFGLLLTPRKGDEGRYHVEGLFYGDDLHLFVQEDFKKILQKYPLQVLSVVEQAMKRVRSVAGDADAHLHIWRSAIEPHGQNILPSFESALIDAARDALIAVVDEYPEEGRRIVERYLRHRHDIFRRLAIHTLRERYNRFKQLAHRVVTNEESLFDFAVYHEYSLLLKYAFDDLSDEHRRKVLRLILHGKGDWDQDKVALFARDMLDMLRDKKLTSAARARLEKLAPEDDRPEHPDFMGYHSGVFVGPRTPITAEELKQKSPAEVFEYLLTWKPGSGERDWPLPPSREGLGELFGSLISQAPEKYIELSSKVAGLRPVYIYHYLSGSLRACREHSEDSPVKWDSIWQQLLDLASSVIPTSPPEKWPDATATTDESAEGELNMVGVREIAADLIQEGLGRTGDSRLPDSLLERTGKILLRLVHDPDPSVEGEDEYERKKDETGGSKPDWYIRAINSVRGRAFEGLIRYSIRRAHKLREETGKWPTELEDAMLQELDRLVGDPCRSIRSVFGFWLEPLYSLDSKWIKSHLENIFPGEAGIWQASWHAFLRFNRLNKALFAVLKDHYQRGIDEATSPEGGDGEDAGESLKALAGHLAAVYIWGWEDLDGADSLIGYFYDKNSDAAAATLANTLARLLSAREVETWQRFERLLKERISIARQNPQAHQEELKAFSFWLINLPFNGCGRLKEMTDALCTVASVALTQSDVSDILEYLEREAREYPVPAARILQLLLSKSPRETWLWYEEKMRNILKAIFEARKDEAGRRAVRIIEYLWREGFWQPYEACKDDVARLSNA